MMINNSMDYNGAKLNFKKEHENLCQDSPLGFVGYFTALLVSRLQSVETAL
jgi:hypothetical protein